MKILLLAVLMLLVSCAGHRNTTDSNGNPIFNSISFNVENFEGYSISQNYYTILNNIHNPNSSVFISKTPTVDDVWNFSTSLPSYFWVITKGATVIKMISLNQTLEGSKSNWNWHVVDVINGTQGEFTAHFKGHLTEHRWLEQKYKTDMLGQELMAAEKGAILIHNKMMLMVVPYNRIYNELKNIVIKYGLHKEDVDIMNVSFNPTNI
ncbi:MAG: hypothetical protein OCD01_10005 [Fibrobacterales bacterium]